MILRVSREVQQKFTNSYDVHAETQSTPTPPSSLYPKPAHSLEFFQSCSVHLVDYLRYVVSLLGFPVRHAPHLVLRVLFAAIACASIWLLDNAEKGYDPSTTAAHTTTAVAGW